MTFKEWRLKCEECATIEKRLMWDYELPFTCLTCGHSAWPCHDTKDKAPGIATDSIPGGIELRHLSRNPERFYSKTDIKRRCNELGWTQAEDTPKPYKVPWSGRRKEPEEVKPLVKSTNES